MKVEWARIAPGRVVVATADGAWLHMPETDEADEFDEPMTGRGTLATTKWLLDGAVGAAHAGRRRTAPAPRLTPIRWAWRLTGYYRTTEATGRLLPDAETRFRRTGRRALADWARMRTDEERGHDALAVRDLRALGYDPGRVLSRFDPPAARALVDYFTRTVRHPSDPIGCVGYSYALERLAAERPAEEVRAVQAMLPPGVHATRCMRMHSAIGADVSHVAETIETVARLRGSERTAIAVATYETARLFYRRRTDLPTDAELEALLTSNAHRRTHGQGRQEQEEDRRAQAQ